MWQTALVSGLSAVAGAVFGGSKKEETTYTTTTYSYNPQYTETTTYSPQYTITYQPIITIDSPEASISPNVSQDTSLKPQTSLSQESEAKSQPSYAKKEGLELKPLLFVGLIVGLGYLLLKND